MIKNSSKISFLVLISLIGLYQCSIFNKNPCHEYNIKPMENFNLSRYGGMWYLYGGEKNYRSNLACFKRFYTITNQNNQYSLTYNDSYAE